MSTKDPFPTKSELPSGKHGGFGEEVANAKEKKKRKKEWSNIFFPQCLAQQWVKYFTPLNKLEAWKITAQPVKVWQSYKQPEAESGISETFMRDAQLHLWKQ